MIKSVLVKSENRPCREIFKCVCHFSDDIEIYL